MEFRTAAFLEARRCLKYMDKQSVEQPEYWANLLGAIANATIAAVPDSVAADVDREMWRREARDRELQTAVQTKIKEKLGGK